MRTENWLNEYVFTVDNFLSLEKCDAYIKMGEDIGYEEALIHTADGIVRVSQHRNNDRVIFRNEAIAEKLWTIAEDFLPTEIEGRKPIAINELIRFYRYDADQQFNWHQDFPYERDNGEKSLLTLLVYLNDGFEGGETSFDDSFSDEPFDELQVSPKQGTALFFWHETHHKGEPVIEGRKYVMRSDVMFSSLEDFGDSEDYEDFEGQ